MRLSFDQRLTWSRSSQALVAPRPLCSVYPSCASQYTAHRTHHKSTIRQGWRAPSLAKSISPQGSFDEGPEPAACTEAEPFWAGQNGLGASPRRTLMVTFTCDKCGAQRVSELSSIEVSKKLSILLGQSHSHSHSWQALELKGPSTLWPGSRAWCWRSAAVARRGTSLQMLGA